MTGVPWNAGAGAPKLGKIIDEHPSWYRRPGVANSATGTDLAHGAAPCSIAGTVARMIAGRAAIDGTDYSRIRILHL